MAWTWLNSIAKFPIYRQHDSMDCGPTCLKMIFKYYGKSVGTERIKNACELTTNGVSLLALADAAESFGLRSVGARLSFEQLIHEADLPCVLYWENGHFVVLLPQSNAKRLVVADPALGKVTYTTNEFLKKWLSAEGPEPKGIALFLSPTAEFHNNHDEREGQGFGTLFKSYITKFRAPIIQVFFGLLIASILQFIFPFITQSIVDIGIRDHDLDFIRIMLIAQFVLFFSQTIAEIIRSRLLLFLSTQVNISILSDFWAKLMRLPLSFFSSKLSGDIMQRINDHHRIEGFITGTALQTIFSLVSFFMFSIVLLAYDIKIFSVFFVSAFLYFVIVLLFLKKRKILDYQRFQLSSREFSMATELIHGIHEIKLSNAEKYKRWQWEGLQASLFRLKYRALALNQVQTIAVFFINQSKNIFTTYLVAISVVEGNLTLGSMLAVQYIIGQMNGPIEQLIGFIQQAQDAKLSLERLNHLHGVPDEVSEESLLTNTISKSGSLRLVDLSFKYPGGVDSMILAGINLEIARGQVTAIVGSSGSGKTTLLKLIQKFYDNYQGELKLGETNLKYISPPYWRSVCGSVMQDGYIFSDTIAKNIALGNMKPDYQRLVRSCEIACILDFVESLPNGFNTKIGNEGIGISSGQRQRLLIARAVYKNPEFIFLDEATNALDANNESMISRKLNSFFQGKTVVIVAHRLSTVKNADKIVVLEKGRIVEQGSHLELLGMRGKYFQLFKNQLDSETIELD